jgi:hypothetical protein
MSITTDAPPKRRGHRRGGMAGRHISGQGLNTRYKPRNLLRALCTIEAMRLRGEGLTYQAIADACGYASRQAAFMAIKAMLNHYYYRKKSHARR